MLDRDYQFAGQNEREEVVLMVRRHWWYFTKSLLIILAMIVVLLVLLYFFGASSITSWTFFIFIGLTLYTLITSWYKWANTMYLLTNERIIIVNQEGWFSRVVSESTLQNILFIAHRTKGIANTMLNFGSIHIRSSGVVEEEIVLDQVGDPYEIQQQIVATQKKYTGKVAEINSEKENQKFWQAEKKEKIIR